MKNAPYAEKTHRDDIGKEKVFHGSFNFEAQSET